MTNLMKTIMTAIFAMVTAVAVAKVTGGNDLMSLYHNYGKIAPDWITVEMEIPSPSNSVEKDIYVKYFTGGRTCTAVWVIQDNVMIDERRRNCN